MSKQTESNFFKLSISSPLAKYAGLYQTLLCGVGSFQQLGNRLMWLGERAHAFRQFHLVREILRMEKAHELLITRFESIKEIMAMVGYGNKSNLVRHFKRFFGFAPSEYRKRHRHRSSHVATRKR